VVAGLGAAAGLGSFIDQAENCGIVGIVADEGFEASDFLIEGLTILRNRGYDSAGVASVGGKGMVTTKYASQRTTSDSIELVAEDMTKHKGNSVGIAHTRWATHGGKTDANAHPHSDSKNRISIVHNGTINNSFDLKKELMEDGVVFKSETDTEVIAHLIGLNLDKGMNLRDSVSHALAKCEGSWGLAVVHKDLPKEIVVACNGSPMTIGLGQGKTYIASETSAFSKYTKNYVSMKDGEIAVIRPGSTVGLDISRMETAVENDVVLSPAPYAHFTLKELMEQPEAIGRAIGYGGRLNGNRVVLGGLDTNVNALKTVTNMLVTGCGTSKNAADLGAKIMRDLHAFDTVQTIDSAECTRNNIPQANGAVLAVSQSGETKDVHRAVKIAMDVDIPVLSVCNVVGSLIARTTGMGVYLNAGREFAVASTKAFSTQVTVMALVALWFRQTREDHLGLPEAPLKREMFDSLQRLPISFGMGLRSRDRCYEIANELRDKQSLFLLGKGYAEPIAMEGALKIKEMCYLHAEGYSGGALKHGPFALIEGKEGAFGATPVICMILDDQHAHHMRICAEEVKARGAKVYVITDKASLARGIDENPVLISPNGPLTAVSAVLPLQLIAYELALMRGINPDTPRNLAKAVTTD
jgi:glucosamine--fructose-6-phosphate aminotransferase (isomerizing)